MIAIIFDVTPAPGQRDRYLDIAAELKPHLAHIDGFISVERFQSLSDPARMLSISFWRDEEGVAQWRRFSEHRAAQSEGREGVFTDYRLRVAHVLRDYGMHDRAEAPDHQAHVPGDS